MNTQTQHTPGPWSCEQKTPRIIVDANGKQVAKALARFDMSFEEYAANSEFIVRACNAHDDLVAKVDAIELDIEAHGVVIKNLRAVNDDLVAALRTALRLIEDETATRSLIATHLRAALAKVTP